MKIILFILIASLFIGCVPKDSSIAVNFNKTNKVVSPSTVLSANVSSVQVINNQLVINGNGFTDVSNVKVDGTAFSENFSIESKTATKIIANSIRAFSFDVSKVFNVILSDAHASATFPIDFSLCNATLNGKGFNCSAPIADKDVLSYDAVSGTWKPRAVSGLNYLGAFNASSNPATGPATQPAGAYYIISASGTIASIPFTIGDWLVSNGSAWQKIDNSTAVLSVFGRNGTVTAQTGDYDLNMLGDVSFPTAPVAGKVLKFDGTNWVAGDDLSGGGAGSVSTAEIADGAVTDAKITSLATSKLTGTISSAQIADGTIVNADINAAAAIDYSKINVPNGAIPYAKLNIADGDIPVAKIAGLPVLSSILAANITDGDTTHAPTGEAVYEALQTKIGTNGGTLSVGTISGVPTPVAPSDVVNKAYVDALATLFITDDIAEGTQLYFTEARVLGTDLAGLNTGVNGPITAADTVLGAFGKMQYQVTDLKAKGQWDKTVNDISYSAGNVSIDKKLRLKSDNANYVEILSPNALASTYTLTLPGNDGNANQVLKTDGAGVLAWVDVNDASVQAFAKSALPTCAAGEVLKSNGTTFSCIADNTGAGAFSGAADRAVITTAGGALGVSATTSTELGYVNGVTSAIQTQINNKQAALGFTPINKAGDTISSGTFDFSGTSALRAANPVAATDVVNKQYLETFGQWTKNGSDIYRTGGNVGIGMTNPFYNLDVTGTMRVLNGAVTYENSAANSSGASLSFWKSRNYAANVTNDEIGFFSFYGHDGTGLYRSAFISSNVDATPASGPHSVPGRLSFFTTPTGSTDSTERLRITSAGNVGIGTTTPQSKLDVNGSVRVGVDATACSATIAGAMRFNTPNVEFCNGTTWVAFSASGAAVASAQITDGTIVDTDINAAANIAATKLGTGVVDNTEFNYLNGVTSSIQTQIDGKQPLDATVTALAAYNTNGILVQTAADTFVGRSIAGTANRLTVTNGNGVTGNPTLDIPTALLPSPVAGSVGKFLKATAADTSVWTSLASSDVTTALGYTPINNAGETVTTGIFTFNNAAVLRTLNPIAGTDVANKQYVDGIAGLWLPNGSDIYRASGKVGIGINNPTTELDVRGTITSSSMGTWGSGPTNTFKAVDPNGLLFSLGLDGTNTKLNLNTQYSTMPIAFSVNNQEAVRIINGGYVGIATTTPIAHLHVNGVGLIGSGNTSFINGSAYVMGPSNTLSYTGGGSGANSMYIFGRSNAISSNATNMSQNSTLIGTSNTVTNAAAVQVFGDGNTLTGAVSFVVGTANTSSAVQGNIVGSLITNNVANSLMIGQSNTAKITILGSNNNVGIGTTNPTSNFHSVASGAKTSAYIGNALSNTATSSTASIIKTGLSVDSTGTWNGATATNIGLNVNATGGTTNYAAVFQGGNVGVGTTTPAARLAIEGSGAVGFQMKTTSAAAVDTMNFINDMNANGNFWFAKGTTTTAAPAAADKLMNITNEGNLEIYGQQVNGTTDASGILSLKTQSGGTRNEVSMEFYADGTDLNTPSGFVGYESNTAYDLTMKNAKAGKLILGTNNTDRVTILSDGKVGIGTSTPTYPLHVVGAAANATASYWNWGGGSTSAIASTSMTPSVSIYASGQISASVMVLNSDARIKNIIGRSDSASDLEKLLQIQITDYKYIDKLTNGGRSTKKVIAQEVEKILPNYVTRRTDFIPNIYKNADRVVHSSDKTVLFMDNVEDLKVGDKIKIYSDKNEEGQVKIVDIDSMSVTVEKLDLNKFGRNVFVYGKEVDDFRAVDYEAIAMLNVSATQALAKKIDVEVERNLSMMRVMQSSIEQHGRKIASLEVENKILKEESKKLRDENKEIRERLLRLEKILLKK